jgi:uncharacterized protein
MIEYAAIFAAGMWAGAQFGRRLPPSVLRVVIVVIGSLALVKILLFD